RGWADNEVARMREAGGPFTWLFLANNSPEHAPALHRSLRAAGAVRVSERVERDGALLRYRWP
ncbi:MAG: hypothetical protein ACREN5_00045, partial [Gemmatimonadales bacterium]